MVRSGALPEAVVISAAETGSKRPGFAELGAIDPQGEVSLTPPRLVIAEVCL